MDSLEGVGAENYGRRRSDLQDDLETEVLQIIKRASCYLIEKVDFSGPSKLFTAELPEDEVASALDFFNHGSEGVHESLPSVEATGAALLACLEALEDALVTRGCFHKLMSANSKDVDQETRCYVMHLVFEAGLPDLRREALKDLLSLLHKLSTNWRNTGWGAFELATVFGPLLLRPEARLTFSDVTPDEREFYCWGSVTLVEEMVRNFQYVFQKNPSVPQARPVRSSWNALPQLYQPPAGDPGGIAARIRQMECLEAFGGRSPPRRPPPKRLETLAHTLPGSLPLGRAGGADVSSRGSGQLGEESKRGSRKRRAASDALASAPQVPQGVPNWLVNRLPQGRPVHQAGRGRGVSVDFADENDVSAFLAHEHATASVTHGPQKGRAQQPPAGAILLDVNRSSFRQDGSIPTHPSSVLGAPRRRPGGTLVQDKPWRPPGPNQHIGGASQQQTQLRVRPEWHPAIHPYFRSAERRTQSNDAQRHSASSLLAASGKEDHASRSQAPLSKLEPVSSSELPFPTARVVRLVPSQPCTASETQTSHPAFIDSDADSETGSPEAVSPLRDQSQAGPVGASEPLEWSGAGQHHSGIDSVNNPANESLQTERGGSGSQLSPLPSLVTRGSLQTPPSVSRPSPESLPLPDWARERVLGPSPPRAPVMLCTAGFGKSSSSEGTPSDGSGTQQGSNELRPTPLLRSTTVPLTGRALDSVARRVQVARVPAEQSSPKTSSDPGVSGAAFQPTMDGALGGAHTAESVIRSSGLESVLPAWDRGSGASGTQAAPGGISGRASALEALASAAIPLSPSPLKAGTAHREGNAQDRVSDKQLPLRDHTADHQHGLLLGLPPGERPLLPRSPPGTRARAPGVPTLEELAFADLPSPGFTPPEPHPEHLPPPSIPAQRGREGPLQSAREGRGSGVTRVHTPEGGSEVLVRHGSEGPSVSGPDVRISLSWPLHISSAEQDAQAGMTAGVASWNLLAVNAEPRPHVADEASAARHRAAQAGAVFDSLLQRGHMSSPPTPVLFRPRSAPPIGTRTDPDAADPPRGPHVPLDALTAVSARLFKNNTAAGYATGPATGASPRRTARSCRGSTAMRTSQSLSELCSGSPDPSGDRSAVSGSELSFNMLATSSSTAGMTRTDCPPESSDSWAARPNGSADEGAAGTPSSRREPWDKPWGGHHEGSRGIEGDPADTHVPDLPLEARAPQAPHGGWEERDGDGSECGQLHSARELLVPSPWRNWRGDPRLSGSHGSAAGYEDGSEAMTDPSDFWEEPSEEAGESVTPGADGRGSLLGKERGPKNLLDHLATAVRLSPRDPQSSAVPGGPGATGPPLPSPSGTTVTQRSSSVRDTLVKFASTLFSPFSFISKQRLANMSLDHERNTSSIGNNSIGNNALKQSSVGKKQPKDTQHAPGLVSSGGTSTPVPRLRIPSVSPSPEFVPRMLRYGTESPQKPGSLRGPPRVPGTALSRRTRTPTRPDHNPQPASQGAAMLLPLEGPPASPATREGGAFKENAPPKQPTQVRGTVASPMRKGGWLNLPPSGQPAAPVGGVDEGVQTGWADGSTEGVVGGTDAGLRRDVAAVFEKARLVLAQRIAGGLPHTGPAGGFRASLPGSMMVSAAPSAASTPRGDGPEGLGIPDMASVRRDPRLQASIEGLRASMETAVWAQTPRLAELGNDRLVEGDASLPPAPQAIFGPSFGQPSASLRSSFMGERDTLMQLPPGVPLDRLLDLGEAMVGIKTPASGAQSPVLVDLDDISPLKLAQFLLAKAPTRAEMQVILNQATTTMQLAPVLAAKPPPPAKKAPPPPPPPPPPPKKASAALSTKKGGAAPPPPPPPPPKKKGAGPPGKQGPPAPPPPPPKGASLAKLTRELRQSKEGPLATPKPKTPGLVTATTAQQRRLKQLHWDKIKEPQEGTVWSRSHGKAVNLNFQELESLFQLMDNQALRKLARQKSNEILLIEHRRAHNICIELAGIRMPFPAIKEALTRMDDSRLSVEQLDALLRAVPEESERRDLHLYLQGKHPKHKGVKDPELLGTVERYFLEIMDINRLQQRIQCLVFTRTFHASLSRVEAQLLLLREACAQLHTSADFMALLQAVLKLGNHLNEGTMRGAAAGFKLDTLLKLADVKGTDRRTSLLHFVLLQLMKENQGLKSLPQQLGQSKAAANLQIGALRSIIGELRAGLKRVTTEIEWAAKVEHDNRLAAEHAAFRDYLMSFHENASLQFEVLQTSEMDTYNDMRSVTEYFGEDFDENDPSRTLRIVRDFMALFDKTLIEIEAQQKAAEAEQRREARRAELRRNCSGISSEAQSSKSLTTVTASPRPLDPAPPPATPPSVASKPSDVASAGFEETGRGAREDGQGALRSHDSQQAITPPPVPLQDADCPESVGSVPTPGPRSPLLLLEGVVHERQAKVAPTPAAAESSLPSPHLVGLFPGSLPEAPPSRPEDIAPSPPPPHLPGVVSPHAIRDRGPADPLPSPPQGFSGPHGLAPHADVGPPAGPPSIRLPLAPVRRTFEMGPENAAVAARPPVTHDGAAARCADGGGAGPAASGAPERRTKEENVSGSGVLSPVEGRTEGGVEDALTASACDCVKDGIASSLGAEWDDARVPVGGGSADVAAARGLERDGRTAGAGCGKEGEVALLEGHERDGGTAPLDLGELGGLLSAGHGHGLQAHPTFIAPGSHHLASNGVPLVSQRALEASPAGPSAPKLASYYESPLASHQGGLPPSPSWASQEVPTSSPGRSPPLAPLPGPSKSCGRLPHAEAILRSPGAPLSGVSGSWGPAMLPPSPSDEGKGVSVGDSHPERSQLGQEPLTLPGEPNLSSFSGRYPVTPLPSSPRFVETHRTASSLEPLIPTGQTAPLGDFSPSPPEFPATFRGTRPPSPLGSSPSGGSRKTPRHDDEGCPAKRVRLRLSTEQHYASPSALQRSLASPSSPGLPPVLYSPALKQPPRGAITWAPGASPRSRSGQSLPEGCIPPIPPGAPGGTVPWANEPSPDFATPDRHNLGTPGVPTVPPTRWMSCRYTSSARSSSLGSRSCSATLQGLASPQTSPSDYRRGPSGSCSKTTSQSMSVGHPGARPQQSLLWTPVSVSSYSTVEGAGSQQTPLRGLFSPFEAIIAASPGDVALSSVSRSLQSSAGAPRRSRAASSDPGPPPRGATLMEESLSFADTDQATGGTPEDAVSARQLVRPKAKVA
eukprot:jgi/Botrbrau1/13505/Bobra.0082s0098.1